ncbi:response regulator [Natrinema amylolyticum]|uniref:response regulator n=1 Tax=Natrinema amylolyticum TaxID=2878679 RepID=UPI001CFB76A3|nr:response regulator [Natrinema amylolyticum]
MSGRDRDSVDVLLVEDETEDVRLIREAFDGVDVETSVHVATDGDEALTMLTDRGDEPPSVPIPDLVLLDLDLPRMSGLELLEAITDEPALARLPVLVLTRSATVEDVHASYELAANAYLMKPTDPEEYDEMVEAVADFWFRRAALPTNGS